MTSLSENGIAECEVILPSGEVKKFVFSATYSDYDNAYNICAFSGYSGVRITSEDMGVSKIVFKLHNLVSGRRYLLGSLEFIADDSGERDCSIDIPNYGLRSYLFNEDSSYRVLFSGLEYGKSYAFGDTSLEVAEDGTAVGEFTVPDYGYVDSKFPDLYSIRLVRAEGSSLETELILYVKRPIKSVVDARAGK